MRANGSGSATGTAGTGTLIAAVESEAIDLHSILVMQRGQVLAEAYRPPFDAQTPHRMYSVTKSFVSSAVGLAVADGLIAVDDRVLDILPELRPADPDARQEGLSIRHLLTMSSGHRQVTLAPPARPVPSLAGFVGERPAVEPGSRFDYNNSCSYALAAIVERVTGETLAEYLRPRLLEPLGIAVRPWLRTEEGITNGGWGLHLTTREVSRFGQLLVQRGRWEGKQVLPSAWIEEATGRRVDCWGNGGSADWTQGYGYQFWRGSHGTYRADGLLGQFCVVFPEHEAVVVTTAGTMRTQRLLELIWEHVVPLVKAGTGEAGPVAFAEDRPGLEGPTQGGGLDGVTLVFGEPIILPTRLYFGQSPVRNVTLDLAGSAPALLIADDRARYRLDIGMGRWAAGVTPLSSGFPEPYKARAAWTSDHALEVDLVFTEAGYRMGFAFHLDPHLYLHLTLPANPGLDGRRLTGRPYP